MSTQYLEDEIYEVEISHKGSTRFVFAYYLGGLWYSQGTNAKLEGKIKPHIEKLPLPLPLTRAAFMGYFRGEAICQELSVDDCIEVFMGILKGQDDITKRLLENLCSDYDTDLATVLAAKPNTTLPDTFTITWSVDDVLSHAKDIGVRCSRKRALEILHAAKKNHDANFGISWETFDYYLGNKK